MTFLASWTIRVAGFAASRRFDRAASDVRRSQEDLLRTILAANADTEYGRRHGFASISGFQEYREHVPVIEYEDISDLVDRMAAGEEGVLTSEAPVMFAMTSGTTGKPKLIPTTPTCRGRAHADLMRTWCYRAQRDHPRVFAGKIVSLVSPAEEGRTDAGIPFGSTSGAIYRDLPALLRAAYLVPYELFAVEDYFTKYYTIVRLSLLEPVTFLCTANPSSIVKLCETGDENADDLLRGLHDGTIRDDLKLPAELRSQIQSTLRPNPEGARRLEKARSRRDGHLLPCDYLPDLEMLGCWKGGTVSAYIDHFPAWFAPDDESHMPPIRDWGYLSSEARCSVPLADEGAGGVLAVASNVYEFVPEDEVTDHPDDRSRWNFLGAHEIEEPRDYHIFLTTTGGLYRYDINDIIRVVGTYRDAPVIEFIRKGRGMSSLTGEKLAVNQVLSAVEDASKAQNITVAHFDAVAVIEQSRYEFEVQTEEPLETEAARELLRAIDARLCEINLEYASKRKSQRLGDPVMHLMRPGWHDAIKKRTGARVFQSKTVILRKEERSTDIENSYRERTVEWGSPSSGS